MKYHNITKDDMLNGTGLRVCLWLSGCEHNCLGCHNSITHDENSGLNFGETEKKEIFLELDKSYIAGLTLTGGDPLHKNNLIEVTKLCKEIKSIYNKTIWLYTGFNFEDIKDLEIINYIDVLCDGKFEIANKCNTLKWVGSSNQRVIDIKKTLNNNKLTLLED